jgi:two-component system chemotaxis response regulator CheY
LHEHFQYPAWLAQGDNPLRSSGESPSGQRDRGTKGGLDIVTIFLVDDEKFIVDLYRDILEANGHTVVGIAADGEEAVRKYREMNEKPVIIIMDQRMPVKDGVSATQEILKMDPSATIFFGSADLHIEKEALAAGAKGFLLKPFRIEELLKAISEAAADKLKVKC